MSPEAHDGRSEQRECQFAPDVVDGRGIVLLLCCYDVIHIYMSYTIDTLTYALIEVTCSLERHYSLVPPPLSPHVEEYPLSLVPVQSTLGYPPDGENATNIALSAFS